MMSVMLNEAYHGIEFDEDIRMQGFDYQEVVPLNHLHPVRRAGRTVVVLSTEMAEWVERECSGQAILASERDDFLIVFNDETDAMLFHTRFA